MSYFFSVRGWIEVAPENFQRAVELIAAARQAASAESRRSLYLKGWCWSDAPVNWTRYIFYGADVVDDGLSLLQEVLGELCSAQLDLSGRFYIRGEDGEKGFVYEVKDDAVVIRDASGNRIERSE